MSTGPSRRAVLGAAAGMVTAAACWGLAAVFAKVAFEAGIPPARLAEARVAIALVVLVLVLAATRPDLMRLPRRDLPTVAGFGLCTAGVNLAYYMAIDRLPVGVAISLQYTGPVMLITVVAIAARRLPPARLLIAAALTLAGAVAVSRALEGGSTLGLVGLAAALASAVLFAAYLVLAERAGRRGLGPVTTLLWGFLAASLAWSIADPWWSWPAGRLASPRVALAVLGVGLVGTLLPFLLAVRAVRVLPASTAAITATAEPVFAAGFAWLLLGQQLAAVQLLGGVLVVAGVVLAQLASGGAPTVTAPEGSGLPAGAGDR